MKSEKLLHAIGKIDDTLIYDAGKNTKAAKMALWRTWSVVAACLCLLLCAAAYSSGLFTESPVTQPLDDTAVTYSCYLNENENMAYFPISFDDRVRYGLVPEGATGLDEETMYVITDEDIGMFMGTVTQCQDESLVGCSAYHFAKYPQYDTICIIDTPYGYEFYTCGWISISVEAGETSDALLDAYGLPDSLEKMEILADDGQLLFTVADETAIAQILQLLSGKKNIGLEENERRYAQLWYDTYGNDKVYFDEESGCCAYRTLPPAEADPIQQAPETFDYALYDQAHALFFRNARQIRITTGSGFAITIYYHPSIRTFSWQDCYCELPEEEAQWLNRLLEIPE